MHDFSVVARSIVLVFAAVCCGPTSTCYSFCSDMSLVSTTCTAAGQAASCGSATTQAFSGPTTINGQSLAYCVGDGGCTPPRYTCIASSCARSFDCTTVTSCTP